MKKFEYRLEKIDIDIKKALGGSEEDLTGDLLKKLDQIGKSGWRLCGVSGNLYYFSREIG